MWYSLALDGTINPSSKYQSYYKELATVTVCSIHTEQQLEKTNYASAENLHECNRQKAHFGRRTNHDRGEEGSCGEDQDSVDRLSTS